MTASTTRGIHIGGLALLIFLLMAATATAAKIAVLEVDIYGYPLYQAIKGLDLPAAIETRMFTVEELEDNQEAKAYITDCAVVFVDVMMEELADYMVENNLLEGRAVYATNHGGDPKKLAEAGFRFDREIMSYGGGNVENTINMIRLAVHRHIDDAVTYAPPAKRKPEGMIYHPEAPERFKDTTSYKKWNMTRSPYRSDKPWVGILFSVDSLGAGHTEATDKLIRRIEGAGFNVLPTIGWESRALSEVFKPENGRPPVDILITFGMKFASTITNDVRQGLIDLDVPVINVIRPYLESIDEWRRSDIGFGPFEVVWAVATPEFSGAIEPTPLIGKTQIVDPDTGRHLMVHDTIDETVDYLIPRLKKWVALRRKPNTEKKVAFLYYNHSGGKQNIRRRLPECIPKPSDHFEANERRRLRCPTHGQAHRRGYQGTGADQRPPHRFLGAGRTRRPAEIPGCGTGDPGGIQDMVRHPSRNLQTKGHPGLGPARRLQGHGGGRQAVHPHGQAGQCGADARTHP